MSLQVFIKWIQSQLSTAGLVLCHLVACQRPLLVESLCGPTSFDVVDRIGLPRSSRLLVANNWPTDTFDLIKTEAIYIHLNKSCFVSIENLIVHYPCFIN